MKDKNREEGEETVYDMPVHTGKTVRRLWDSVSDQRRRLAAVIASVVFYTILSVIAPLYSAYIVDTIWNSIKEAMETGTAFRVTWEQGGREILIYLLIYTAAGIFYTMQSFLMSSFAERLSLRLRTEAAQKLNRLPLSYFDHSKTGEVLSRMTNDMDKASEAIQTGLLKLFTAIGMVIGSVAMMFYFHVLLTFVFLIVMGISLLFTKIVAAKTLHYASLRQQAVSDVTGKVEEAYSGRPVVKAFNLEEHSRRRLFRANEELAKASRKADFMINSVNPAVRLINRGGQVLIAVLCGKFLIDGVLTVGIFQAFFQYVYQASEPLTEAAYMINSLQSALASIERLYDFLDEEEMSPDSEGTALRQKVEGMVEFKNVRFGYDKNKILMKDICFKVRPGQKVAIVGSTGAGKTTLINLLMRFYEINGGKILLDGTDIRTVPRTELRKHFGMVLQDTWLFEGTIAENIAYGKPDASREEIVEAAKAARVDFFVRTLPQGYDTLLNSDAENISIGQKQLLTIARVLLCNPTVLILDEATSSVDTRTELEINRATKMLMKDRTSFIIAHRLSTIIDADLILVMQKGDIAEVGSHRELLEKNGVYAEIYNSQFA